MPQEVVVVGAGILGASIAWHLARAGRAPAVVDTAPGGLATPASWAWINASWGNAEPYARLRMRAMQEWRRLAGEVPDLGVEWCGSLVWAEMTEDDLRKFVEERQAQGYDIRLVDRDEVTKIEPNLLEPPPLAAHSPAEGAVDPKAAALALLADAEKLGANLVIGQPVERLLLDGERVAGVALADGTTLKADHVVLAAGAATPLLAAQAGADIPIHEVPGLLATTDPSLRLLNGLVVGPGMMLRQLPDGRLVGAGHYAGSDPGSDPAGVAEAAVANFRAAFNGGERLRLGGWTVGRRPMPKDGLPIVGPAAPGLHVAVTHSGITLAPAIGLFVAEEITSGRRDQLLAPFGLDRF
ncbi:FAD dependent oxidoreductase, partial [Hyaloraphidium curvatum]